METERFVSWATTHPGNVRKYNEDALLDRPDLGLWAVADGAGGHARGDVASRMAIETLDSIPPNLGAAEMLVEVRQRIAETHSALQTMQDGHDISATTIVVLIARDAHYACLWAGDSRAYLLRGDELTQLTRDHSLVQELVDESIISPEEAEGHPNSNIITRAVGAEGDVELDKVSDRLQAGDRFLLCSDGLCKELPATDLAELLAVRPPRSPTEHLVQAALLHPARDNITAVAIEILSAAADNEEAGEAPTE
jgi:protein phosphatase/serine/threonine-protein phosphatase Stp1